MAEEEAPPEPETGEGTFAFSDGSKYGSHVLSSLSPSVCVRLRLMRQCHPHSALSALCGACTDGRWLKRDGTKMRHGRGVYIDGASEDQVYEGEWFEDAMQGRGTFRYASGAKYEVRLDLLHRLPFTQPPICPAP